LSRVLPMSMARKGEDMRAIIATLLLFLLAPL